MVHHDLNSSAIMKLCGAVWNCLPPGTKARTDQSEWYDFTAYKTASVVVSGLLSLCAVLLTFFHKQQDNKAQERRKEKAEAEARVRQKDKLVNRSLQLYFKLMKRPIHQVIRVIHEKEKELKQYISTDENGQPQVKLNAVLLHDIATYAKLSIRREENGFKTTSYNTGNKDKPFGQFYSVTYIQDVCNDMDDVTDLLVTVSRGVESKLFTSVVRNDLTKVKLEVFIEHLYEFFLNYYAQIYQEEREGQERDVESLVRENNYASFLMSRVVVVKNYLSGNNEGNELRFTHYTTDTEHTVGPPPVTDNIETRNRGIMHRSKALPFKSRRKNRQQNEENIPLQNF